MSFLIWKSLSKIKKRLELNVKGRMAFFIEKLDMIQKYNIISGLNSIVQKII